MCSLQSCPRRRASLQGHRERYLAAGMNDCPAKPYKKDILKAMLEKWFEEVPGAPLAVAAREPVAV